MKCLVQMILVSLFLESVGTFKLSFLSKEDLDDSDSSSDSSSEEEPTYPEYPLNWLDDSVSFIILFLIKFHYFICIQYTLTFNMNVAYHNNLFRCKS